MTQFKKFAWGGAAVALAMVMAMSMLVSTAQAASVTQRADATVAPATNLGNGSGVATSVPLVLTLLAGEMQNTETLTLTTPAGWAITEATVTVGSSPATTLTLNGTGVLSDVGAVGYNNTATFTATANNNAAAVLTFNINVRPQTAGAAAGDIALGGSGVAANANVGTLTPQTGGNISATIGGAVPVDGSSSTTVTAWVFNGGAVQTSKSVTFNASMGGFGTTGTTSVTAFTDGNGQATAVYRGIGGASGTDTITITTPAPAAGVGSVSATLSAAQAGSPSALAFVNAWNVGATGNVSTNVAANSTAPTPNYTSPQTGTNVVFRVTDAAGAGSGLAAQVLQITTDKGGLVAYNGTCTTTSPKAINVTTQTGNASFGGTATTGPGLAGVRFCAGTGANLGTATITATNITTTMATASTTVTTAGVPATITTNWTEGALEVTVTDADGNAVADGTHVRVTMADTIGAVAPDGESTRGGKATFAVALTGATGNAIITVRDDSSTGTVRLTRSINVTATAPTTPPVTGDGSLTAPSFGTGNVGSAVFAGGTIEQLAVQVTAAGGTGVWVQDTTGTWRSYLVGGPGVVNTGFNTAFAAGFAGATAVIVVK